MTGEVLARGALQDVLVHNHLAAVFVDDQVVVLSELASAVLLAVPEDGWVAIGSVVASLVAQFGEPPGEDAATITQRLVGELLDHGIVRTTMIDSADDELGLG
ncbi:MAG: hypothetical protein ACSLEW_14640 [Nocardioides sp.]